MERQQMNKRLIVLTAVLASLPAFVADPVATAASAPEEAPTAPPVSAFFTAGPCSDSFCTQCSSYALAQCTSQGKNFWYECIVSNSSCVCRVTCQGGVALVEGIR